MTTNHATRPSDSQGQREWDTGYAYGLDDNLIPHWRRAAYSRLFLLGYDVGKGQIDRKVQEAWEENQRYGEWL